MGVAAGRVVGRAGMTVGVRAGTAVGGTGVAAERMAGVLVGWASLAGAVAWGCGVEERLADCGAGWLVWGAAAGAGGVITGEPATAGCTRPRTMASTVRSGVGCGMSGPVL